MKTTKTVMMSFVTWTANGRFIQNIKKAGGTVGVSRETAEETIVVISGTSQAACQRKVAEAGEVGGRWRQVIWGIEFDTFQTKNENARR